jgi:hypothetical protein
MKNVILTAALLMTALRAGAEGMPQMLGSDPLSRQILTKTAQENGGVTAAVRVGSGQAIELKLPEVTAAAPVAQLAPAASAPALYLQTAIPVQKPVKAKKAKPARRAIDQLKRAAEAAAKPR